MSFEHLFVELALFCRLSTFWKWVSVTFSDVFYYTNYSRFDFFHLFFMNFQVYVTCRYILSI